jgi:cell division ATPase FtsA
VAADQLAEATGLPVVAAGSEAASRRGALTTPGATVDSAVVDLGGGTVDVTTAHGETIVAGAGDLLTVSIAALLGLPRGAAEWVKRVPCHRAETPQLLVGEDGSRTFVDRPLPGDHVGSLVAPGPAGWLAFDRSLAAAEWRALRLALKREVLGGAVRRALRPAGRLPDTVVLVGGPAGDDEAVTTVARVLPEHTVVGRGDVAGTLGHRYAVAYGLALAATEGT